MLFYEAMKEIQDECKGDEPIWFAFVTWKNDDTIGNTYVPESILIDKSMTIIKVKKTTNTVASIEEVTDSIEKLEAQPNNALIIDDENNDVFIPVDARVSKHEDDTLALITLVNVMETGGEHGAEAKSALAYMLHRALEG